MRHHEPTIISVSADTHILCVGKDGPRQMATLQTHQGGLQPTSPGSSSPLFYLQTGYRLSQPSTYLSPLPVESLADPALVLPHPIDPEAVSRAQSCTQPYHVSAVTLPVDPAANLAAPSDSVPTCAERGSDTEQVPDQGNLKETSGHRTRFMPRSCQKQPEHPWDQQNDTQLGAYGTEGESCPRLCGKIYSGEHSERAEAETRAGVCAALLSRAGADRDSEFVQEHAEDEEVAGGAGGKE